MAETGWIEKLFETLGRHRIWDWHLRSLTKLSLTFSSINWLDSGPMWSCIWQIGAPSELGRKISMPEHLFEVDNWSHRLNFVPHFRLHFAAIAITSKAIGSSAAWIRVYFRISLHWWTLVFRSSLRVRLKLGGDFEDHLGLTSRPFRRATFANKQWLRPWFYFGNLKKLNKELFRNLFHNKELLVP